MKNKLNIFRVGSKVYFHHANGVLVRKNRVRLAALNSFVLLLVAGGFFGSYVYVLPALQNTSYFQTNNIASNNIVSAEQDPAEIAKQPIVKEDEFLKASINEKIASFPGSGKWSVYAYELGSDKTVNINSDKDYDAASLYKLFLLEALENKVAFDRWQYTYTDGMSLKSCAEVMLHTVDDPCGESLADYLGWDSINEFNTKSGFHKTELADIGGRKTTAVDVGSLLIRLKKGHTLSDNARRFVFDTLYQQSYDKGLAKGCGDCRVAAKSGELTGISHDAGVITHGSKSYVLVIMSENGSFDQISEITKLVDKRFNSNL